MRLKPSSASGTAIAGDVRAGKTFSSDSAPEGANGQLADLGTVIITASGTAQKSIPDGIHSNSRVLQVPVPAAKVLSDTTIAGVQGTVPNHGGAHVLGNQATAGILSGDGVNCGYIMPAQGYYNGTSTWARMPQPDLWPSSILQGRTIMGVAGSIPVFAGATYSGQQGSWANSPADQIIDVIVPQGYYDGQSWISVTPEPDLIPSNIRNGVNIFGVVGTLMEGNRYATGTFINPSDNRLIVSGLTFQSTLIVWFSSGYVGVWSTRTGLYNYVGKASLYNDNISTYYPMANASVTNTGFSLIVGLSNVQLTWYAFE